MGCIRGARATGILGLALAGPAGSPSWHCQPLALPTSSASEPGAQLRQSTRGQVTSTVFIACDRSQ